MKILLVQPSRLLDDGTVYHSKRRWLLGMTLPYLAALTPPGHEVRIQDDCCEEIDFSGDYDLVGISFMSHQAPRAYRIAKRFRDRGVPVVMGGFHVTLDPAEAADHADAVVWGEAELTWSQVIEDAGAGLLKKIYKAERLSDLAGLPVPRYDLVDLGRYKIPNIPAQTTRGCPWGCNYCEVTQVYGGKFRFRPAPEVIEEVRAISRSTGRKIVYFVDDNFIANRDHAVGIMEGLAPLGVGWTALATASVGDDPELLKMMRKTGCMHLNIGVESISEVSLGAINKKQNKIREYERQIAAIRRTGIDFSLNIMFGLDGDTPDVFDATLEFLVKMKAPMAFMFILAPRVGTKIREELLAEGRILHSDWTKYCGYECVFRPQGMSVRELEEGFWRIHRRFYSLPSIAYRLLVPPRRYTPQEILTNAVFMWGARKRIHPLAYY